MPLHSFPDPSVHPESPDPKNPDPEAPTTLDGLNPIKLKLQEPLGLRMPQQVELMLATPPLSPRQLARKIKLRDLGHIR